MERKDMYQLIDEKENKLYVNRLRSQFVIVWDNNYPEYKYKTMQIFRGCGIETKLVGSYHSVEEVENDKKNITYTSNDEFYTQNLVNFYEILEIAKKELLYQKDIDVLYLEEEE